MGYYHYQKYDIRNHDHHDPLIEISEKERKRDRDREIHILIVHWERE